MGRTKRLYFTDTYMFEATGAVESVTPLDDGDGDKQLEGAAAEPAAAQTHVVILDQTIVHPQGGGQPSDTGELVSVDGATVFRVAHATANRDTGAIEHFGAFAAPDMSFAPGQQVTIKVDEAKRRMHARLHSAGHLLDAAMRDIGYGHLEPSKGYHFADGPYVEYIGAIPNDEREAAMERLNAAIATLIEQDADVAVVHEDTPDGDVLRTVNVGGIPCPCGGTHVQRSSEIRGVAVQDIKKKKKNVRVYYTISGGE